MGEERYVIEMVALLALIERCAPKAPLQALVTAARTASEFEPLVLATHQNGRALTVRAMSRPEAIALASEMKVAGQPVRLGLLGIDAREFDRRGLPLGEAFDSCTNLRVAGELLTRDAKALTVDPRRATRSRTQPPDKVVREVAADDTPPQPPAPSRPTTAPFQPRAWDVYGQAQASAALVYGSAP
jgi:type IV secretion system protein VirB1